MAQFVRGSFNFPERDLLDKIVREVKSANAISALDKNGRTDLEKFEKDVVKALKTQGIKAARKQVLWEEGIEVAGRYGFTSGDEGPGKGKGCLDYIGMV